MLIKHFTMGSYSVLWIIPLFPFEFYSDKIMHSDVTH